jgi:hypothetical protein
LVTNVSRFSQHTKWHVFLTNSLRTLAVRLSGPRRSLAFPFQGEPIGVVKLLGC